MDSKKVIIILAIVLIVVLGLVFFIRETEENQVVPKSEEELIEAWIKENNLNQYGDSKDTMYTGGTPLFNEKTGQSVDRYEYILRNHPDKPWVKR